MRFVQKIFSNFWILLEFNLHRKWNRMKWRISATFCFALSPYKKPTEGPNRRNKGYHHCMVNSLGDQFTVRWSRPHFSECWMLLKNLYQSRWTKKYNANEAPFRAFMSNFTVQKHPCENDRTLGGWGNLVPRFLSLPPSRKEGEPWKRGCGWGSELRARALAFHQCGLGLL